MNTNEDSRIRLLLVDDEVEFLEAVAPPLVRRGFSLTLAQSGTIALRLLTHRTFDAAVVDVRMPGISGVDLFYKLKALAPGLPVIILTGHPTVKDAFQTSRDGVFEYLVKPCDVDRLARVVRTAVAERATRPSPDGRVVSSAVLTGARLLLAGSDQGYIQSLKAELERRGVDVTAVDSFADALRQAEDKAVEVAVIESEIRGAHGQDFVSSLRQVRPEVEVIVLAGHTSPQEAVEILRAGAFVFLTKPQTVDTLLQWVHDAILSSRQRQSAEQENVVTGILDGQPD